MVPGKLFGPFPSIRLQSFNVQGNVVDGRMRSHSGGLEMEPPFHRIVDNRLQLPAMRRPIDGLVTDEWSDDLGERPTATETI